MTFVVEVLERFFDKSREEATRIMLQVHHEGLGIICDVCTYDDAKAKVTEVTKFARQNNQSLQCTMERTA